MLGLAKTGGDVKDFRGRVAVVTGAASGIGRALAARFAAEGMKLVLADVEPGALAAAARELAAAGCETLAVETDVSRAEQVEALARRTLDAFGAVHIVCNNAGVFTGGLCWEAPIADYEWVLGVNVWGVIHGIRSFVPDPARAGRRRSRGEHRLDGGAHHPALRRHLPHEQARRAGALRVPAPRAGAARLAGPRLRAVSRAGGDPHRRGRAQPPRAPAARSRARRPAPERDLVQQAIAQGVATGTPPAKIADRVLDAIREERFYVLSEDAWRRSSRDPAARTSGWPATRRSRRPVSG